MNAKIIIECTSRTNEHELRYIHYFRRDHNTPCSPQNLYTTIVQFQFRLAITVVPREFEDSG